MTTGVQSEVAEVVARALEACGKEPGPLLLVLHAVQDEMGFIPDEAVGFIAEGLNVSRAEVHGVVSFYHYFRKNRPGSHVVYLCRAEACQSMNGRALEAHASTSLGVALHGTTSDGTFTLEPVYCLGNCALSPAVMIDHELYGRVTPQRFDSIIDGWKAR